MFEVVECIQGTPEWFAARRGLPTASMFATVMAKGEGKTRSKYMRELAGEIITEAVVEGYINSHMDRGTAMEDDARKFYSFKTDLDVTQVGFIRHMKNGKAIAGGSPDGLVGDAGAIELKTALPHILIETLMKDAVPTDHAAQLQGNMWVADRDWIDFVMYWPKMPTFIKRVRRDDAYIKTLVGEVTRFNAELELLVETVRRFG